MPGIKSAFRTPTLHQSFLFLYLQIYWLFAGKFCGTYTGGPLKFRVTGAELFGFLVESFKVDVGPSQVVRSRRCRADPSHLSWIHWSVLAFEAFRDTNKLKS